MSRTRRTFSAAFKSKVIFEALKEKETLESLTKPELIPIQISVWKADAIKNMSSVFTNAKPEKKENDIPVARLFEEIGQLNMENDFLKKKLR